MRTSRFRIGAFKTDGIPCFPGVRLEGFSRAAADRARAFLQAHLEEIQAILVDGSRTHHERYLHVFRLLRNRDDELAHGFNDPRRSRMIGQLVAIHAYGLLEAAELERFTEGTRDTVKSLAKEFTR